MSMELQQPDSVPELSRYRVPWTVFDSWLGVVMLVLIDVALLIITLRGSRAELAQSAGIILLELAYLLPVILIFAWKRVHWKYLGFRKFEAEGAGSGLRPAGRCLSCYIVA